MQFLAKRLALVSTLLGARQSQSRRIFVAQPDMVHFRLMTSYNFV